MEDNLDYILGGISAIHTELEKANKWLHKLYDIEMTLLAKDDAATFETINTVHNKLKMFMDEDWEDKLK